MSRALDLLEALASAGGELSLTAVVTATGLSPATAHRLLRTLVGRNYVMQVDGRRYALGAGLIPLGTAAGRLLGGLAAPYLGRLVATTGETANLALIEGDDAVYVAQVPSPRRLRIFAEVGRRVGLHCTAVGKVLLAARIRAEVEDLAARTGLAPRTPRTITSVPTLLAELERVRTDGFASDDGEEEVGVRCAAVPVVWRDMTVAAMSVSAPTDRMPDDAVPALLSALRAAAGALGGGLTDGRGATR